MNTTILSVQMLKSKTYFYQIKFKNIENHNQTIAYIFPIRNFELDGDGQFINKYNLCVVEYNPKEIKNEEGKVTGHIEFSYSDSWAFMFFDVQDAIGDRLFEKMILSKELYYSLHTVNGNNILSFNVDNQFVVVIDKSNPTITFDMIPLQDKVIRVNRKIKNDIRILELSTEQIARYYGYFAKYKFSCEAFLDFVNLMESK